MKKAGRAAILDTASSWSHTSDLGRVSVDSGAIPRAECVTPAAEVGLPRLWSHMGDLEGALTSCFGRAAVITWGPAYYPEFWGMQQAWGTGTS